MKVTGMNRTTEQRNLLRIYSIEEKRRSLCISGNYLLDHYDHRRAGNQTDREEDPHTGECTGNTDR